MKSPSTEIPQTSHLLAVSSLRLLPSPLCLFTIVMADGRECYLSLPSYQQASSTDAALQVNEARALRVAEIMNDFRTLQFHISQHQIDAPSQDEYWEEGYVVARQCAAEAQAILATHFNPGLVVQGSDNGDGEQERLQLQR